MTCRVTIHDPGLDDLLYGAAASRIVEAGATLVARNAARNAPNGGPGRGVRETYKSSRARPTATGVAATAFTFDPFGHLVEWGSVNNPPYAPLRRGAEQSGFRLRLNAKGQQ